MGKKIRVLAFLMVLSCLFLGVSCKNSLGADIPKKKTSVSVDDFILQTQGCFKDEQVDLIFRDKYSKNIDINKFEIALKNESLATLKEGKFCPKGIGNVEIRVIFEGKEKTFDFTILDEKGPSIHEIQGAGHKSPYENNKVENVVGVITKVSYSKKYKNYSFFFQETNPDNNLNTSEGIFAYAIKCDNTLKIGDKISLSGKVCEYVQKGKYDKDGDEIIKSYLSTTQIKFGKATILSSDNPLPSSIEIDSVHHKVPTLKMMDNKNIDDPNYNFDRTKHGGDFWESLEGMRVKITNPLAVSPSNYGKVYVVAENGKNATPKIKSGRLLLTANDLNPEKIPVKIGSDCKVNVGDSFKSSLEGPLGFDTYTHYPMIELVKELSETDVVSSSKKREVSEIGKVKKDDVLTVASFNIENFSMKYGKYSSRDADKKVEDLAETIVKGLNCPDIIAIAEMQDDTGAPKSDDSTVESSENAKALIAAIKALNSSSDYTYTDIAPKNNEDGGKPNGNIRVGFLYSSRVSLKEGTKGDASTNVNITNKGGDISLNNNPVRIIDPAFEGSRKPLLGEFKFNNQSVFVIACHFKSKGGDAPMMSAVNPAPLYTEEKRTPQCQAVNTVIDELLAVDSNAKIVVMGDFNDFSWSNPMKTLMGSDNALISLADKLLNPEDAYSYNYSGNTQELDHIFVSKSLESASPKVDLVNRYSEFWDQCTDHDPSLASFQF